MISVPGRISVCSLSAFLSLCLPRLTKLGHLGRQAQLWSWLNVVQITLQIVPSELLSFSCLNTFVIRCFRAFAIISSARLETDGLLFNSLRGHSPMKVNSWLLVVEQRVAGVFSHRPAAG